MSNLKQIILEEIQGLYESGEANAEAYPYTEKTGADWKWYKFTTEDNDQYGVTIKNNSLLTNLLNAWEVEFNTVDDPENFKKVVNKGRLYKVMATVVKIVGEFTNMSHPDVLTFVPAQNSPDDFRRFNMYMNFIKKNIPSNYRVNDDKATNLIYMINQDIFNKQDNELRQIQSGVRKSLRQPATDTEYKQIEYINNLLKTHIVQTYGGRIKESEEVMNENVYKVYHGTNNKFGKFDFKNSTQGVVWFTDNIDSINSGDHGGMGNKNIMTRYITINNPAGWDEYDKYSLGELTHLGYDGVILPHGSEYNDYIVFSNNNISAKPAKTVNEYIDEEIMTTVANLPQFGDRLPSISEVGEGNSPSFPFRFQNVADDEMEYTFSSEENNYIVVVQNIDYNGGVWEIQFVTEGGTPEDVVNDGNMYKVMATIIQIANDFITKFKPNILKFRPIKDSERKERNGDDKRRYNLYMAYVKKHIIPQYFAYEYGDYIHIERKIKN